MQIVGKFQAVASADGGVADHVTEQLAQWQGRKFAKADGGAAIVRYSGVEALEEKTEVEFNGARLVDYQVIEPIDGGSLQTYVRVLAGPETVHFNCTLSIEQSGGLSRPNIDLYTPRFVREIYGKDSWQFALGAEVIVPKHINVGSSDVDTFIGLMESRQRRLPLVVVSEFDGRTIAGDLHQRLAGDLCGLGHVCLLSRDASWAITDRLGKEWSVYNGAVRLFWPFRANSEHPQNHRLWTFDALTRYGQGEIEIRDQLRRQLRFQLLEASTFLSDNPAFKSFEQALERDRRDKVIGREGLDAQSLKQEIALLLAKLEEKDRDIATLQSNVEALTIALRSGPAPVSAGQIEDAPPTTVLDAVNVARSKFAGLLRFGDDVDDQIGALNPEAGPPDKVLRYLETLSRLSAALESGALGKSVPIWMRDEGVVVSIESETTKKNRDAQRERTFRFGGEGRHCEFHAKPTDGVPPDQCIRVYFAQADKAPRVWIGYVGRHFE